MISLQRAKGWDERVTGHKGHNFMSDKARAHNLELLFSMYIRVQVIAKTQIALVESPESHLG